MKEIANLKERSEIVMGMIRAAVAHNQPCPTNGHIAAALDMGSPSVGAGIISFLECAGIISVERSRLARVVTITATGEKTAGTIDRPCTFKRRSSPSFRWNRTRDAILMEGIANELDFEQVAHLTGSSPNECAARFDDLAAAMGRQAA